MIDKNNVHAADAGRGFVRGLEGTALLGPVVGPCRAGIPEHVIEFEGAEYLCTFNLEGWRL